ncbi:MAG: LysO family transporter [Spirochaetales bacterium]|nr:LysO family transporter [Spirochaetales bacterium]
MLTVIIIMTAGMAAGYLLRNYRNLFRGLDRTVSYVIYILLFLLGITVGRNETIVRNFHLIGLKALIITAASVAGSLVLAALVYHFFFRHDHIDESGSTADRSPGASSDQGLQGDEA